MAMPAWLAAAITSSSRMEPPGWTMAVMPASAASSMLSGKGKKASEASTHPVGFFARRALRQMHADHTVGLAGAHADQGAILDEGDGVGLDMLHRFPGERQVGQLGRSWRAFGGGGPGLGVFVDGVGGLHQDAAAERANIVIHGTRSAGNRVHRQDTQVALPPEDLEGVVIVAWCDDDFVEHGVHSLGGSGGDVAIETDDTAEGRHRVAFIRQFVSLRDVIAGREAAGVGVLDHADRRVIVVADRAPGGVGIHQVVERQFPAVQLGGPGQSARTAAGGDVQGAALVGVLAVAQAGDPRQADGDLLGHLLLGRGVVGQVVGHRRVVHRHVLESLGGQSAPLLSVQTGTGKGVGDPLVVGRVHDDGDGREILGRGPQHGGAADVDVLQGVVQT